MLPFARLRSQATKTRNAGIDKELKCENIF